MAKSGQFKKDRSFNGKRPGVTPNRQKNSAAALAKQKTFKKGEINPKAPKTPEDRHYKDRPICGAKRTGNSASGPGICCQFAGWGTPHPGVGLCRYHGGNLPSSVKNGARMKAAQAVAIYGLPKDIDPQTALVEEVQRTAGHVDWLQAKVNGMEDESQLRQSTDQGVQPSVWIEMYQRERQHLVNVCATAIKCGVAERTVRLAEEQGKLLAMVLAAFIRDPELQLTPRQLAFAPKIIRKHILTAPVDNITDLVTASVINDPEKAKKDSEFIDV